MVENLIIVKDLKENNLLEEIRIEGSVTEELQEAQEQRDMAKEKALQEQDKEVLHEKEMLEIDNNFNEIVNEVSKQYIKEKDLAIAQYIINKQQKELEQKESILDKVTEECRKQMTTYEDSILEIFPGKLLNIMADKLQDLINKQKESSKKIRNAEIAALEAQLNPHVLYNTLDTINWMAIEAEQYNISNIISALAKTMRYGIDFSNSIVYVEEEVNWLKQYLTIH